MPIKVIELFGQVGSNLLEVEVLCVVDVVEWRCKESRNSLLALGNIANQNGIYTYLYSYRSTTYKAHAKFSDFVDATPIHAKCIDNHRVCRNL